MPFSHTPSRPTSSSSSSSSSPPLPPDSTSSTPLLPAPKQDPAMFVPKARPANLTQASSTGVSSSDTRFPFAEPLQSNRHVYALCNPVASPGSPGACTAQFEDDLWSCANTKCLQQVNAAVERSAKFRSLAADAVGDAAGPPSSKSSPASLVSAAASAMQDGAVLHQCMRTLCTPQYIAAYSLACIDLEDPILLKANVGLDSMPREGWRDQQAISNYREYSARASLRAQGRLVAPPAENSTLRIGICTLSRPLGSDCTASVLTRMGEITDPHALPLATEPKYWPSLGTVLVPKLGPSSPDAFDLSVPQNYYLPTVTCNSSSNTLTAIVSTRGGACTSSSQCMFGTCIDNKCALDVTKSTLTTSDLESLNTRRRDASASPSSMPVTTPNAGSTSSGPPEPVIFMLPVVFLVALMVWVSVRRHASTRKHDRLARNLRGLGQMTATGRPGLLGGVAFAPTSTARPALEAWGPRAASDRASESFHGCGSLERGHAMLDPIDHETLPRYSTFAHRMSMIFVSAVMTTLNRRASVASGPLDEEEVVLDLTNAPPVPPLPPVVASGSAQAAANAIMPPPPSYDVHREHSVVDVSVAGSVRSSRPSLDSLATAGTGGGAPEPLVVSTSRPASLLRVSLSRQHSVRALADQAEARTALLTPVADEGGEDDELGSANSPSVVS